MPKLRKGRSKYVTSVNPEPVEPQKFPAIGTQFSDQDHVFEIEVSPQVMDNLSTLSKEEVEKRIGKNQWVLKYKAVNKKKRPVPNMFPESAKVVRHLPSNPLKNLPHLPRKAPIFILTDWLTTERIEKLKIEENEDLREEERRLLTHVLRLNERSIVFAEKEQGTFQKKYSSDYKMPVIVSALIFNFFRPFFLPLLCQHRNLIAVHTLFLQSRLPLFPT